MRADHPGVQFGNIQQGVEHTVDGGDGLLDLPDQGLGLGIADPIRQVGEKQAQRVDGLAQVVAGGRQKPGLGRVGLLRSLASGVQNLSRRLSSLMSV